MAVQVTGALWRKLRRALVENSVAGWASLGAGAWGLPGLMMADTEGAAGSHSGTASRCEGSSVLVLPARMSLIISNRMVGEQQTLKSAFCTPSAAACAANWFM